nr:MULTISPECIES: DNA polymerase [unclassified Sphingomonas]
MAPATLTAIGVDLLQLVWKEKLEYDPIDVVGKERVKSRYYSKRKGYYVTSNDNVPIEQLAFYLPLATECYHGGRGEQFWFGPAFEDNWTDYDLAGAYPTAMALIGYPDWRNIKPTTKLDDFTADQLGVAHVSFEFPKSVRFPTMPVRTENGLVFPRSGVSNCSAPEIALARSLRAKLKIHHGVIVPTDPERPVFRDFIRDCVAKRQSYPKGSLYNLFWKELSNSSYGKTAQGLHAKRVFDLKDRTMKPLPPSKITNPFFAAYITSFVRAALGEVMNGLPEGVCVFSCTTDGFLTNATAGQIDASQGAICKLFSESRDMLTGDPTVLEIKHHVRQPLGWRTRGQATLIEGNTDKGDGVNIVLAKGGIYTAWDLDTTRLQNGFVTDLFLKRTPTDRIEMATKTGIRDMINFDADLVEKETSKRLNMEFDWKRRPIAAWDAASPNHLAFATAAWDSVDQFVEMRTYWESFAISDQPRCLKTADDYRAFAVSVLSQSSLKDGGSKYLKKTDPDLKRLRQSLCGAWRNSKAGLTKGVDCKTAQQFADKLCAGGISCKLSDVENARTGFKPENCPKTPAVLIALNRLIEVFPTLEIDTLVTSNDGIDILDALSKSNPFVLTKEIRTADPISENSMIST